MKNNFGETVQEYYTDRDINKKWIVLIFLGAVLLAGAYFGLFAKVGEVTIVPAEEQNFNLSEDNQTFVSKNKINTTPINMAYIEFQCENDQPIEIECMVDWTSLLPEFDFLETGNETEEVNGTGLEGPPEPNGSVTE